MALALAAITAGAPALAQPGDSQAAEGNASATVVRPISAVALTDLSFGAITLGNGGATGGTVVVSATGGPATYTGSVRQTCAGSAACQPHPARFRVSGEPERAYRVTVPEAITARGSRTATLLPVAALVTASATGWTLDRQGTGAFTVGGTLQVPDGTPPDSYRAEFPVIVAYD